MWEGSFWENPLLSIRKALPCVGCQIKLHNGKLWPSVKCVMFCMADNIPETKHKFPDGEEKLASLWIYSGPHPDVFLGKGTSKVSKGSLRGLAFSKQGSQGVKGSSQHASTKTLPEYQELRGLGDPSLPTPQQGPASTSPSAFPQKRPQMRITWQRGQTSVSDLKSGLNIEMHPLF